MHRARAGIEFGVVFACRFREMLRGRRELIPEPVEVDALATFDQPLHVGTAEAKMPEQRTLQNFIPWTDTGSGASINTSRLTRCGCSAAKANATMLPMSCATTATLPILSASSRPEISRPW